MSNINVRVVGTANVSQMYAEFGRLEAQITALNAQLAKMVATKMDPKGYERMAAAQAVNSKNFRNAAASTGMFEVQQLRLNKATDDYVTKLQKQKLSFVDMLKQQRIAKAAFKEQIAMQSMMARSSRTATTHGKTMVDTVMPNAVSSAAYKDAGMRLAFLNEHLKSGATQMVNWGKNTQWAGRQLSMGFTMPLVAVGAAAAVMSYKVDKALTRVQKVYNTTAQSGMAQQKELDQVRQAGLESAMTAAKLYGSAAEDTLNVQAELAAAGRKGTELQKDTVEVMRISRLGELDYADSIKTTIALQSVFNMNSQELTKTFNYMNAVENATSLQTADFAKAIPIAAAPVKAFGGDIQELGILLTAMKSRGIEATQGANAIKAAMQRLGRPSKQVQEEWTALTHTDITQIFDKSKNLLDLFTNISKATDDLGKKDKIKAFAGLFGTYQVTRMMALVSGMKDLHNETTQTGTAFKLAGQDAGSWAKIAAQEVKRYQDSISGKWDIAIQEMKLQLSTLGKPFIEVATQIISFISDIISAINKLPHAVKVFAAFPIVVAAVAGPVLMLTGLMANLVGNGIKGFTILGSAINSVTARLEVMTTSQKAAALIAEKETVAVNEQATSQEMLAASIMKVVEAQAMANRMTRRADLERLVAGGMNPRAAVRMMGPLQSATPGAMSPTSGTVLSTPVAAKSSGIIARNMKSIAISGGVATAAMTTMMVSSNKTVDHIAQMALLLSFIGPGIGKVGGALIGAGKAAVTAGKAASGAGMAVRAGAAAATAELGMGAVAATGIGAALVVAGGAAYLWWKHEHNITEEKRAQNIAMYKQNQMLDDALKITQQTQQTLTVPTLTTSTPGQASRFNQTVAAFQNTKEGQGIVDAYKNADKATRDATIAANVYYDVINAKGGNATKATQALAAMFVATGDTIGEATIKAQQLGQTMGAAFSGLRSAQGKSKFFGDEFMKAATTGDTTSAAQQGTELGKQLMTAMATSTKEEAPMLFSGVQQSINKQWGEAMKAVQSDPVTGATFKAMGIDSRKEFQQAFADFNNGDMTMKELQDKYHLTGTTMANTFQAASTAMGQLNHYTESTRASEGALVKYYVETMHLSKDIVTLAQLRSQWEYKMLFVNKQTEKSLARQEIIRRQSIQNKGMLGLIINSLGMQKQAHQAITKEVWKEIKAAEIANGTWVDGKKKVEDLKRSVNGVPRTVTLKFNLQQTVDTFQAGMQNVQQSMADDISSGFDTRMQNAMDARQKMWDNREAAQSARFDAQSRALDNHWQKKKDAAEKMWDQRIKKVQEASKAEQKASDLRDKMYDDEIANMQRLADQANQNIDFNTAINSGNFDEAAKIKNDAAAASAQSELEKEKAKADARSQKRIDKLAKREDRLNTRKDSYMKRLDKEEEAAKAHQQKIQQIQANSLKAQADADTKAYQAEWDARKKSLDAQLQLFMDFIAGNQKQLKQHMKDVGLSYDKFQKDVIEPKGQTWGDYFGEKLHAGIRDAGLKIASDSMWGQMGQAGIKGILNGMGFPSMGSFKKFIMTGNLPSTFGKPIKAANSPAGVHGGGHKFGTQNVSHRGGMFDGGRGSGRLGRQGKLRSDEGYSLLQHGEMVINKKSAAQHRSTLEAINEGLPPGIGGAGPPGSGAMTMGALSALFMRGAATAISNVVSSKVKATASASPGGLFSPAALAGWDADQLKNASTIANVGRGLGMSKRDIEIGIMTAITESGLRNIAGGDRDSIGLFQQRPSQGWGTPEQVHNPTYAATKFFNTLRGVGNRADMAPWLAAQAVQRSAFSDGSNYHAHWMDAIGIYTKGLARKAGGVTGGFVAGPGGKHRPVPAGIGLTQGLHDVSTGYAAVDFAAGIGTPAYAVGNGVITRSEAITSGGSPGNGLYSIPYRSYGNVEYLKLDGGPTVLYAHLNKRLAHAGQRVTGGSKIGITGNTGNSTGPHLHFGDSDGNPMEFLKKGGTIRWDNTPAMLHKDERVLTAPLTRKLDDGIDRFANGGGDEYNVNVNLYGTDVDADHVADVVVKKLKREASRKPTNRSNR